MQELANPKVRSEVVVQTDVLKEILTFKTRYHR